PQIAAFYKSLLARAATLPGVQTAAATSGIPFGNAGNSSGSFNIQSHPVPKGGMGPHADIRLITPEYFRAMRVPLIQGRYFLDQDGPEAQQVAIVDDVLAKTYWPNENPVGQHVTFN